MVSIIIPNYNGKRYLRECIQSIYDSTVVDIEVIVVDNLSQDDDLLWIKKEYPKIILKKLNKNYGFSYAVNRGIKIAKYPYVLLLNNDTKILEGFVEALLNTIRSDKRIFAVSSKMLRYDDATLIDDAGDEYTIFGWGYKIGDGENSVNHNNYKEVFSACGGAALYRKSVFSKIGYFDQAFFAYLEDLDIGYRARNYGYKNVYCPEAEVLHIGSATSGSRHNAFKIKLAARNNIYVPYKNMPLPQLLINLPALIIGILIKYIYFYKKGFGNEYIQGLDEGLSTLGQVRRMKFNCSQLKYYLKIQALLIKNSIKLVKIHLK